MQSQRGISDVIQAAVDSVLEAVGSMVAALKKI